MKILYLKLKNFIGIYSGLGRDEIEIDFSKNKSKFVLLKGSNGSGKTTLLSSLNPFATSNDTRSSIILEGKEGYKEIHYDINGDIYVIKHYISKTTKSFISKNGEELNANGGVKLFNDLILNIFGIDKNYFKIARLGSNMTNFIDMPTAERKKYISNFVSDVDYYLSMHKNANEILKELNSTNKYLENELAKLDSIANLPSTP
jgi:DNA repair exonuclease SbcCD ATPase subunit